MSIVVLAMPFSPKLGEIDGGAFTSHIRARPLRCGGGSRRSRWGRGRAYGTVRVCGAPRSPPPHFRSPAIPFPFSPQAPPSFPSSFRVQMVGGFLAPSLPIFPTKKEVVNNSRSGTRRGAAEATGRGRAVHCMHTRGLPRARATWAAPAPLRRDSQSQNTPSRHQHRTQEGRRCRDANHRFSDSDDGSCG